MVYKLLSPLKSKSNDSRTLQENQQNPTLQRI